MCRSRAARTSLWFRGLRVVGEGILSSAASVVNSSVTALHPAHWVRVDRRELTFLLFLRRHRLRQVCCDKLVRRHKVDLLTHLEHVFDLTELVFLAEQIHLVVVVFHELEFFFATLYTLANSLSVVDPLLLRRGHSFVLEVDRVYCVCPGPLLAVYALSSTGAGPTVDLGQSVRIYYIEQLSRRTLGCDQNLRDGSL